MFSNMYSLISKEKNDDNCVVDNMFTVFWFNKQNEFERGAGDRGRGDLSTLTKFTSGGQMSENLHLNTQS